MKDIFEAVKIRLSSPLFGYFLLSFVSLNWKGLYYLAFAGDKVTALEKIQYFHDYTNLWTTLFWPFVIAIIFICAQPWVRYLTFLVSDMPNRKNSLLQLKTEHDLIVERQALEKTRSDIALGKEDELIERAKRDKAVSDIDDETIRGDLQAQINELRMERDAVKRTENAATPKELMEFAKQLRETAQKVSVVESQSLLGRAAKLEHEAERILKSRIKR